MVQFRVEGWSSLKAMQGVWYMEGDTMIVVIDTETTHYSASLARVIEIGAVVDHPELGRQTFQSLSDPGVDLDKCKDALQINGISKEEVLSAPKEEEVAWKFNDWLRGLGKPENLELAGFNSNKYDALILSASPWDIPIFKWKYDVMFMAMKPMENAGVLTFNPQYGSFKWPKLSEAERFFGIVRDGKAHRALSDSIATLDILRKLLIPSEEREMEAEDTYEQSLRSIGGG